MEKVIDSLFEEMKKEWDTESFGYFLSDIYALGWYDGQSSETHENAIPFLPLMQSEIAKQYIEELLAKYDEEFDEGNLE